MIVGLEPDVVLCDVMLEGRDAGFELAARLSDPDRSS